MAKPNSRRSFDGASNQIKKLHTGLSGIISGHLAVLPTSDVAKGISVSLESYTDENVPAGAQQDLEAAQSQIAPLVQDVADSLNAEGGDNAMKELEGGGGFVESSDAGAIDTMRTHQNEVAVEAVSIQMLAHNNQKSWYNGYDQEPSFSKDTRVSSVGSFGAAGSVTELSVNARPAMESYDEIESEKWREHSYTLTMLASKQHEFLELFYRSYVTTPDEAGFSLSVRRNMVSQGFTHSTDGKAVDLPSTQVNLMESMLDHRILETESTRAYPCMIDDNKDLFIDDSEGFDPIPRTQAGESFESQFLKFGEKISLVGVSQTPSRMQKGAMDFTDSLDSRLAIDLLAIHVGGEAVVLDLNRTTKAQFVAVREGQFREMTLDYRPTTIPLNAKTLGVNKKVPTALKAMLDAGYEVQLELNLGGNASLQTSGTEVFCNRIRVHKVVSTRNSEQEIDMADPKVKGLVDALDLKAIGWYPEARLSNINQLERGLMLDSEVRKEGFQIPTLSPFVIIKPSQSDEEKVYPKIEVLQTAYRISMRNNGLTTLLNRKEALRTTLGNDRQHKIESNLDMEGVGQYYIRPYYTEASIDLLTDLNSLSSKDKMADIRGLITGRINEMAYRSDMYTGYSSALEVCFPGSTPKPHLAIGTDKRLPQYIMQQGDDRTVGVGLNYTLASISDLRMVNQIIMSFVLPSVKEVHPLHFGVMAMIPEWLVNFQMIRKQRVSQEIRLTPRYRYFNFLPLMMVIIVKHLEEAIAMRTALDINSKTVDQFPTEVSYAAAKASINGEDTEDKGEDGEDDNNQTGKP